MSGTAHDRPALRRTSLYTGALAAALTGGVLVVGGAMLFSRRLVTTYEDRLLEERTTLARASGGHLEALLLSDLGHARSLAEAALTGSVAAADPISPLRGMFAAGTFVVDLEGRPLLATPPEAAAWAGRPLRQEAGRNRGAVAVGLASLPGRDWALVAGIGIGGPDGRVAAVAGGAVPAGVLSDLLRRTLSTKWQSSANLQIVDATGRVVADTGGSIAGTPTDHGSLLARAIRERAPVQGRCHGCHESEGDPRPARSDEVIAFAPLERLPLGIAVRQRTSEALAPAALLRRRLVGAAGVLGILVVALVALSVHGAVRPVARLLRAVRELAPAGRGARLPSFRAREVADLAAALEDWRGRTDESLSIAERHRAALHAEVEASRRLLGALASITESSLQAESALAIARLGLDRLLEILGFSAGALRLSHGSRAFDAQRGEFGVPPSEAGAACDRLLDGCGATTGPTGCRSCLVPVAALVPGDPSDRTLLVADLAVARGPRVSVVLCAADHRSSIDERRLHALLHHIVVGAAHVLLEEQERLREGQRREYLSRVLEAQEEERKRIARELHDAVSQELAALQLQLERLSALPLPARAAETLPQLVGRVHATLETVRRMMLDLRPVVLDSMGFLTALQWTLQRLQQEHGVRVSFTVEGDAVEPPDELRVPLFRIFQESLHNVVRHARAEHVFVTVDFAPSAVGLTIEDDGIGFDREGVQIPPDDRGRGLGLLGMEERAKILGGSLLIETAPGEGTAVRVSVPLPARAGVGAVA